MYLLRFTSGASVPFPGGCWPSSHRYAQRCSSGAAPLQGQRSTADRVEIRRDSFGIPHILADDEEAAGFASGTRWLKTMRRKSAVAIYRPAARRPGISGRASWKRTSRCAAR